MNIRYFFTYRMRKLVLLLPGVLILLSPLGCTYYDKHFSYLNLVGPNSNSIRDENTAKKFWSGVRPLSTLSDTHYKLGRYYQKRGRHDKAIEEFKKAVRQDVHFCKAYNAIGMSYDKLTKCKSAHASYEQALQCAPNQAYIYNNYGYSCLLCGEHGKAVTMLKKAAQLAEDDNPRIKGNLQLAQSIAEQPLILKDRQQLADDISGQPLEDANLTKKISTEIIHRQTGPTASRNQAPGHTSISSPKKNEIIQHTTVPEKTIASSSIEVSNGNGITGMAGRSAKYFKLFGFNISRITNASHFHFAESTIYYREGYLEAAKTLAGVIPGSQEFKKVRSLERPSLNIRVLLGRNLAQLQFPERYWPPNNTTSNDTKPIVQAGDTSMKNCDYH